jgi:Bax protein
MREQMNYRIAFVGLFLSALLIALYDVSRQKMAVSDAMPEQTSQQKPQLAKKEHKVKEKHVTVRDKKSRFFSFLLPHIIAGNMEILKHRQELVRLHKSWIFDGRLTDPELKQLESLALYYKVSLKAGVNEAVFSKLKKRVDIIPASMALAQAANESGWGTSRFARQGNNYFGQWCFRKGCGIVPSERDDGGKHEVASFESASHSVKSYFRNINTNRAYKSLRETRAQLRSANKTIKGEVLAEDLQHYSERGEKYIEELQKIIRVNGLSKWDEQLTHAATDYPRQAVPTDKNTSDSGLVQ